jgi:hypothetical protein
VIRNFKLPVLAAAAIVPAAIMVLGAAAAGPNLLANGTFDANVGNWTAAVSPPATIAWNGGAMTVTNMSAPAATTSGAAKQCVNGVMAGTTYTLKADTFIAPGQKRTGGADTRLFWHAGANCGGATISTPFGAYTTATGAWVTASSDFVAPAGAMSVEVMLMTNQYAVAAGDDAAAHLATKWDNVSFGEKTVAPANTPVATPPATSTPSPAVVPPTPVATTTPAGQVSTTTPSATSTPDQPSTPETVQPGSGEPVKSLGDTEVVATPKAKQPLPPATGSGNHAAREDGLLDITPAALLALAVVAMAGLVLTVVSVLRARQDEI